VRTLQTHSDRAAGRSTLPLAVLAICLSVAASRADELSPRDLKRLDLEELTEVRVTTASKKSESWFEAPSPVYVIRGEDIRRSGVTSIPEALRLAPGVQVARINSNQWSIGIRGFASRLARSMLVLIDGRSVYSPLFAGTYWEVQDVLLEDVDRIEVVRGPGGSLWGANAVNGIVNIITKSSADTQGVLATAGGGTEERGFGGVRYGGRISEATTYRVYGKYFDRDGEFTPGAGDFDRWHMGQGGFRTDTVFSDADDLSVSGDIYAGEAGQRTAITRLEPPSMETVQEDSNLAGGNLLARWRHGFQDGAESNLRLYYDRTDREDPTFEENRDTFDTEADYRWQPFARNDVVWGLGYRVSSGDTNGVETIEFLPHRRTEHLVTAFLEDEITVVPDRLRLKIGSKFEHNVYTGFEAQPSARLTWLIAADHMAWSSVSRAVRTPSRVERDLQADFLLDPNTPAFGRLVGNGGFDAEKLIAYELGYRMRVSRQGYAALSLFYNEYDDLLGVETGPSFQEDSPSPRSVTPFFLRNSIEGQSYGVELSSWLYPTSWLEIQATYSYLLLTLDRKDGSEDATTVRSTEGSAPHHQGSMRFFVDLPRSFELDSSLRYVDNLPALGVPSYVTLDVRLGWRPTPNWELSAVGQNLVEKRHPEWGSTSGPTTEIERGGYAKVTWHF
jgi:iron complex outermembrane receptor protein